MLFKSIDGLLVGTKYLAWAIGLLGMVGSVLLFLVNIPLGMGSAMVFVASLFLSIAVTLLLLPKKLAAGKLAGGKRYLIGAVACVIALAVMFAVWNICGGFPILNLVFA